MLNLLPTFITTLQVFFPAAVVDDVVGVDVVVDDVVIVVIELHSGRLFVVPRLRERKKTFSGTIFAQNRNFV